MSVEARFYIQRVEVSYFGNSSGYAPPAPAAKIFMYPVTRGEANAAWASATPAGEFTMTVKSEAVEWFKARAGKELRIILDDRPSEETE